MSNLTFKERLKIEYLLDCKIKITKIAELMKRNHSIISREIKRNSTTFFGYDAVVAQAAADRKSKITNTRKLVKYPELLQYVYDRMKLDKWSPEQIAGRLKKHPPPEIHGLYISHEQIYEYIQNEGRAPDGKYLYKYLPKEKPKRQTRGTRKPRKVTIPDRETIHNRPQEVETKTTFGHFEGDLMFCKKAPIQVIYERKSQLIRIQKLKSKRSEDNIKAIVKSMETLPERLVKTLTLDNGSENVKHADLKEFYNIQIYFCDTYAAWQKGGVENSNGLLRRYLPKKADLTTVTQKQLYQIQEIQNNKPRKSLNYQTPNEILKLEMVL